MINNVTIIGGFGKNGEKEAVDHVEFKMGDVISIVGPTGSGKTTLIEDVELFANENTPSRRKVLINGEIPDEALANDPSRNPIALITQHTNFLSEMQRSRGAGDP
jgi:ABC-type lipoprotein export system ATPase subunit